MLTDYPLMVDSSNSFVVRFGGAHTLSLTLPHFLTLTLSISHTNTHTYTFSVTHSLSLAHSVTLTHTHTRTHTLSLTHTQPLAELWVQDVDDQVTGDSITPF